MPKKLTALTAYDSSFAKIFDRCGIDIILVGDSLGNVIKGDDNTLSVSMNEMIYHTKNVVKVCNNATIITDMPYLSYENAAQALNNAQDLINAGADMVKIEGGERYLNIFKIFKKNNIRVCGHLGLQPQSIQTMGYKVQGRDKKRADEIIKDAIILEKSGIELLILECVPSELAKKITKLLTIKTIGIGAGLATNGQILVSYDMLGITSGNIPKFVKNFAQDCNITDAVKKYIDAVQKLEFPTIDHSYK